MENDDNDESLHEAGNEPEAIGVRHIHWTFHNDRSDTIKVIGRKGTEEVTTKAGCAMIERLGEFLQTPRTAGVRQTQEDPSTFVGIQWGTMKGESVMDLPAETRLTHLDHGTFLVTRVTPKECPETHQPKPVTHPQAADFRAPQERLAPMASILHRTVDAAGRCPEPMQTTSTTETETRKLRKRQLFNWATWTTIAWEKAVTEALQAGIKEGQLRGVVQGVMAQKQGIQNQQEKEAIQYAALRRIKNAHQALNPAGRHQKRQRRAKTEGRRPLGDKGRRQPSADQIHLAPTHQPSIHKNNPTPSHQHTQARCGLPPFHEETAVSTPILISRITQVRKHFPQDHGSAHCPHTRFGQRARATVKADRNAPEGRKNCHPTTTSTTDHDSMHGPGDRQRTTGQENGQDGSVVGVRCTNC